MGTPLPPPVSMMGKQLEEKQEQQAPPPPVAADKNPPAFSVVSIPPAPASSESPWPLQSLDQKLLVVGLKSSSQLAIVSGCVFALGLLLTPCTATSLGAWWRWCHELTGEDATVLPAFALRTAVQAAAASLALVLPGRRLAGLGTRQLLACVAWAVTVRNLYWFGSVIQLIVNSGAGPFVGSLVSVVGYPYIVFASLSAYFVGLCLLHESLITCTAVAEIAERRWNRSIYFWTMRLSMAATDPNWTVRMIACWALLSAGAFAVIAAYIVYLLAPCPTSLLSSRSPSSSSHDHDSSSSSFWSWWWPCQELTTKADLDLARVLMPRLAWCSALQAAAAAVALALLLWRRFRSCRILALVALAATATNHCRFARLLGPVFDAWVGESLGFVVGGGYVFVIFPIVALLNLTALAAQLAQGPISRRC